MIKVAEIIINIDGEGYTVGKAENGKFYFAWGYEYPFSESVPEQDVLDCENGVQWFNTKGEAISEYNSIREAWNNLIVR